MELINGYQAVIKCSHPQLVNGEAKCRVGADQDLSLLARNSPSALTFDRATLIHQSPAHCTGSIAA